MSRRQATPLWIRDGSSAALERVAFEASATGFDESFVQRLIFDHPGCLPLNDIEAGLPDFRSVCCEVPTPHGPIDNLLMNGNGDVAIAEVKLWRNPEARRKVVAQALDYASCLFEMGYSEFEAQALKGDFCGRPRPQKLYSLFDDPDGMGESEFVDAVSHNLSHGRIIILVVGDGIRAETERLAQALQSHAGFHFTFALVELAVFRTPSDGGLLVVPSTLAQTQLIERGIVRIDDGTRNVHIHPTPPQPSGKGAGNITSEQFFEAMARRHPLLPERLKRLIAGMESFGAYPDFKKALNFKWDGPSRTYHLGMIQRDGQIWTDNAGSSEPLHLSHQYIAELAAAFGGQIEKSKLGGKWYVTFGGKAPRAEQVMDRFDAWRDIAEAHIGRLEAASDD